jgi:hypothetical protein
MTIVGIGHKVCSRCGEEKSEDDFYRDSTRKDGRYPACRSCAATAKKVSNDRLRESDPEEWGRRQRQYKDRYAARHAHRLPRLRYHQRIRRQHGLSREDYQSMLEQQGGSCAICGSIEPGGNGDVLYVDHCHETGAVRGLLCNKCNVGLGMFNDDLDRMLKASAYLEATK